MPTGEYEHIKIYELKKNDVSNDSKTKRLIGDENEIKIKVLLFELYWYRIHNYKYYYKIKANQKYSNEVW